MPTLRRYFPGTVEIRAEGDSSSRIRGRAAEFNVWSPVYGGAMFGWRERIDPGFFDAVLEDDVRGLFNHDVNFVLGRTTAGTMSIDKDDQGLNYEIEAPATQSVKDFVVEPIRRRDVTGSSFSFELMDEESDGEPGDKWEKGADGTWERTLLRAKRCYDVGPVTFPWYPTTEASVDAAQRSLRAWQTRHDDAGGAVEAPPAEPTPAPALDATPVVTEQLAAEAVDEVEADLQSLRTQLAGVV